MIIYFKIRTACGKRKRNRVKIIEPWRRLERWKKYRPNFARKKIQTEEKVLLSVPRPISPKQWLLQKNQMEIANKNVWSYLWWYEIAYLRMTYEYYFYFYYKAKLDRKIEIKRMNYMFIIFYSVKDNILRDESLKKMARGFPLKALWRLKTNDYLF